MRQEYQRIDLRDQPRFQVDVIDTDSIFLRLIQNGSYFGHPKIGWDQCGSLSLPCSAALTKNGTKSSTAAGSGLLHSKMKSVTNPILVQQFSFALA